ncbi:hypothetical protein GBAR_LOCUS14376 [Geodia barretti]|uniref:Uncharacterized protein n=1 Tax=Geodia barretti TaxID=519541 RepID=A0AA35WPW2_GEOBA|nr:hypothetical protein GBAR_LOCUS14376 [Geodia barretti]
MSSSDSLALDTPAALVPAVAAAAPAPPLAELGTAGDSNSFLRKLFLQRLPANVRMVLASADDSTDLHKLADMADKVMEVVSPTVAALSGDHPDHPDRTDASEMEQLREKIILLTSQQMSHK